MRILGCLSFALVFGVLCFALGLSHSPDGFASRWAPVLTMPSEGITIQRVTRWTNS